MTDLFDPIAIAGLELRNRTLMTTHGPRLGQERYERYLAERAGGGVALVILPVVAGLYGGTTYPPPVGPVTGSEEDAVAPRQDTDAGRAHFDAAVPRLRAQAAAVRAGGAIAFGQLNHPGANRHWENLQPAVGPSGGRGDHPPNPVHELDPAEITRLVRDFGEDARRAAEAGLQGIEIHAAHGYLVAQFLSPTYNRRRDAYGGDLRGRLRFLEEVIDEARALSGGLPVGVRLAASDEAPAIARALEGTAAFVNISLGSFTGMSGGRPGIPYVAPFPVEEGPALAWARAVKRAVGDLPVAVAGRIQSPALARRVIAEGAADLVGFTRALIADPRFVAKLAEGRDSDVNLCIACMECHQRRVITCPVNPEAGREAELEVRPAPRSRRVAVVGGGPAGMEAAYRAARRGHEVTLFEADGHLGGALQVFTRDPARAPWRPLLDRYARDLAAAGVEIRLGRHVGAPELAGFDTVVVATGGREEMEGTTSAAVLSGAFAPQGDVTVAMGADDGLDGPLTALLLAGRGCRVRLATEGYVAGGGLEAGLLHVVTRALLEAGVELATLTRVRAAADGVELENVLTEMSRPAPGTVVWASGRVARDELAAELRDRGIEVTLAGDALAPRRLVHAVLDGARVGQAL